MQKRQNLLQRLGMQTTLALSLLMSGFSHAEQFLKKQFTLNINNCPRVVEITGDLDENKVTITATQKTDFEKIKNSPNPRKEYAKRVVSNDLANLSGPNIAVIHPKDTQIIPTSQTLYLAPSLEPVKGIPYGKDKTTVLMMEGGKAGIEKTLSLLGINPVARQAIKALASWELSRQERRNAKNLEKITQIPEAEITRINNHNPPSSKWAQAPYKREWSFEINSQDSEHLPYLAVQIGLNAGGETFYTPKIIERIPLKDKGSKKITKPGNTVSIEELFELKEEPKEEWAKEMIKKGPIREINLRELPTPYIVLVDLDQEKKPYYVRNALGIKRNAKLKAWILGYELMIQNPGFFKSHINNLYLNTTKPFLDGEMGRGYLSWNVLTDGIFLIPRKVPKDIPKYRESWKNEIEKRRQMGMSFEEIEKKRAVIVFARKFDSREKNFYLVFGPYSSEKPINKITYQKVSPKNIR